MPELSDLPVEILRMIAERCEPRPRFNLRSTSKSMKEVVDQSKFILDSVEWSFWYNLPLLKITFVFIIEDGHTARHEIKGGIENEDLMEKTAKWMANIFQNAEIGFFRIVVGAFGDRLAEDFLQRVKENLKSPWKARNIYCLSRLIDPFWIFDKSYLQRLTCNLGDPNFFQERKKILTNLDEVEIWQTMNITDEDVLSMKATKIDLKSENFSAEMFNELVNKFIAKSIICSEFEIRNPKGYCISKIKIPDGFSNPTRKEGTHRKFDGDKKMMLWVSNITVMFKITQRSNNESDDDSSDSDSDLDNDSEEEDEDDSDDDDV